MVFPQHTDSSSPRSCDPADWDPLELGIPSRKDTQLSSASSGVSSGSPLSHSPAASQSSNSSLSPRQQSPVGWQHGLIWGKFADDNSALPPPPGITDTAPIWGPHHGNEVGLFVEIESWKLEALWWLNRAFTVHNNIIDIAETDVIFWFVKLKSLS